MARLFVKACAVLLAAATTMVVGPIGAACAGVVPSAGSGTVQSVAPAEAPGVQATPAASPVAGVDKSTMQATAPVAKATAPTVAKRGAGGPDGRQDRGAGGEGCGSGGADGREDRGAGGEGCGSGGPGGREDRGAGGADGREDRGAGGADGREDRGADGEGCGPDHADGDERGSSCGADGGERGSSGGADGGAGGSAGDDWSQTADSLDRGCSGRSGGSVHDRVGTDARRAFDRRGARAGPQHGDAAAIRQQLADTGARDERRPARRGVASGRRDHGPGCRDPRSGRRGPRPTSHDRRTADRGTQDSHRDADPASGDTLQRQRGTVARSRTYAEPRSSAFLPARDRASGRLPGPTRTRRMDGRSRP